MTFEIAYWSIAAVLFVPCWRAVFRGMINDGYGAPDMGDIVLVGLVATMAGFAMAVAFPLTSAAWLVTRRVPDPESLARRLGGETRQARMKRLEREARAADRRVRELERELRIADEVRL